MGREQRRRKERGEGERKEKKKRKEKGKGEGKKKKDRGKRERGAADFSATTAGPVGHARRSGDTQRVARKMGQRLKSGVGTAKISGKGLGV